MIITKATSKHTLEILEMYHSAIKFIRSTGNTVQWNDFDALRRKVIDDIHESRLYILLEEDDGIEAAFALCLGKEPTYEKIDGQWKYDTSYGTIHRLCVKKRRNGYASACLKYALRICPHLRIDTHPSNYPMLSLIRKFGFEQCGTIYVEDLTERIAFEKNMMFSDLLLDWYNENKRNLPWRNNPTPYQVWISEIMLQQTRAEAVKNYYARFLDAMPTIDDLANADEDVCLKLWQGLGYYSRVKNLHKGAQSLVKQHNGFLPNTYSDLIKVPGIGDYTANAILAFSFHQPTIAVDGNLFRVYARLTEDNRPFSEESKKACHDYFFCELQEKPEEFNQALMDLGEMICLPHGKPRCENCPLSSFCLAFSHHSQEDYPVKKKKAEKKQVDVSVFLLHFKEKIIIEKRESTGLLASLYQFPNVESRLSEKQAMSYLHDLGFSINKISGIGSAKHIFTHLIWNMNGYEVFLDSVPKEKQFLFVSKEELLNTYSIPSAFSFYLNYLLRKSQID